MEPQQSFKESGVIFPLDCLTPAECAEFREEVNIIISMCDSRRLCILGQARGHHLAAALMSTERIYNLVQAHTGWTSVRLAECGISIKSPYSKRQNVWHTDGAVKIHGGYLVALWISIAKTRRDSGFIFLSELSCFGDLKKLPMPKKNHYVKDDADVERKIIRVPLKTGQGVLFDCNNPHANLQNYSASARSGVLGFFTKDEP
jgi:ectoine hydroxylase-related dioxygenase (phytanoyl-CoA dioxygenase family)